MNLKTNKLKSVKQTKKQNDICNQNSLVNQNPNSFLNFSIKKYNCIDLMKRIKIKNQMNKSIQNK